MLPKVVCRIMVRYRSGGAHRLFHPRLLPGIEGSNHPVIHMTECPTYYSTCQYHTLSLRCRVKIHIPHHYCAHKLSSSRPPLLFTDDLLQNHIKQIVAELNQIQNQLTADQTVTGQATTQNHGKRLRFLEPVVSKIKQHQQYTADISGLEDIISGRFGFCVLFLNFFAQVGFT